MYHLHFVLTILSNSCFPVTSVDYIPINAWNVVATQYPTHLPQSTPAKKEDLQFTNPVGWAKLQSLVSRVSEEEQTEWVSQMGFRLLSMLVLVGGGEREDRKGGRDRERRKEWRRETVRWLSCNYESSMKRWLLFELKYDLSSLARRSHPSDQLVENLDLGMQHFPTPIVTRTRLRQKC